MLWNTTHDLTIFWRYFPTFHVWRQILHSCQVLHAKFGGKLYLFSFSFKSLIIFLYYPYLIKCNSNHWNIWRYRVLLSSNWDAVYYQKLGYTQNIYSLFLLIGLLNTCSDCYNRYYHKQDGYKKLTTIRFAQYIWSESARILIVPDIFLFFFLVSPPVVVANGYSR